MSAETRTTKILSILPGLLLSVLIGFASVYAADFLGTTVLGYERSPVSSVMVALLLGMIIGNAVRLPAVLEGGLQFAGKKVLRLGIILLGIRLSIGQVALLGAVGVPIVIGCIAAALVITLAIAKKLMLPERLATLIAVGTSICGVSAIVATAPAIAADEEEVAYAISVITIFGLLATLIYPLIAHAVFAGDPVASGLFLGTSIHDTSQVTGAGLVYSELYAAPDALNAATVTKLVRNLFMGALIPLIAVIRHKGSGQARKKQGISRISQIIPLFVIGFIALAVLRTIGDATMASSGTAFGFVGESEWVSMIDAAKSTTGYCLVTALAALGMKIRFSKLAHLGLKPFLAGLGAALAVGVVSIGLVKLLGPLVQL